MGSSQPWSNTAQKLIDLSREAGEPVWLGPTVDRIRREHPDCDLTQAELAALVSDLVIKQQWALGR
jgi:hypothetical protein